MEVIICVDPTPQQLSWEMCQEASSTDRTRPESVRAIWSTVWGSRLRYLWNTSFGLLGGGGKELVADTVSDVFVSIFEAGACVKAREGLDGIVEVRMTLIVGHSEVHLLCAHQINNKIYILVWNINQSTMESRSSLWIQGRDYLLLDFLLRSVSGVMKYEKLSKEQFKAETSSNTALTKIQLMLLPVFT